MSPVGSVKGYKYIDLGSSLLDVIVKQIQSINNDDELKNALAQIILDNTRNFMPYDTGYLDEHTYVKDGKIIINVTSPLNTKEEYTVKVNVLKTDKVEIDKEEFKADSSYKGKWVVVIIVSVVALLFGFTLCKKEGK